MMKRTMRIGLLLGVLALLCVVQTASAYYDPGVQRWINRDPIGEVELANLYNFVGNDSLARVDDSGLGWWPKKRKDPKGNDWPPPKPLPPKQINPDPNTPTTKVNPKSPPTQKTCQCSGLIAFAGVMNKMWTDLSESKIIEKAIAECDKTPHSGSGVDKCCVIAKSGVEGCVTGKVVWYTASGYVVDKPCSAVEQEGSLGLWPDHGKRTRHRNQYKPW